MVDDGAWESALFAVCSRVCSNRHGLIRKYGLNMCRQCFRQYADDIGFKKVFYYQGVTCSCLFVTNNDYVQGVPKKTDTQFYFGDNFSNSAPILTILSLLQAEIYGV